MVTAAHGQHGNAGLESLLRGLLFLSVLGLLCRTLFRLCRLLALVLLLGPRADVFGRLRCRLGARLLDTSVRTCASRCLRGGCPPGWQRCDRRAIARPHRLRRRGRYRCASAGLLDLVRHSRRRSSSVRAGPRRQRSGTCAHDLRRRQRDRRPSGNERGDRLGRDRRGRRGSNHCWHGSSEMSLRGDGTLERLAVCGSTRRSHDRHVCDVVDRRRVAHVRDMRVVLDAHADVHHGCGTGDHSRWGADGCRHDEAGARPRRRRNEHARRADRAEPHGHTEGWRRQGQAQATGWMKTAPGGLQCPVINTTAPSRFS